MVDEIINMGFKKLLFFGCSKSGIASLIFSNVAAQKHPNVYCWSFSPVVVVKWGQKILNNNEDISPRWTTEMLDVNIKKCVDEYGDVRPFINNKVKKTIVSYSCNENWTFDKEQFELLKQYNVIEDFIPYDSIVYNSDYHTIHNTLAFYWKREREKLYKKITEMTME